MRLVVVGASLAGMRAARAARTKGFDGELTVIGAEAHPPYTRPPLSKELLAGAQEAADVDLRSDALDVQWRLGISAAGLDRNARVVRLADGAEVPYDRVIVATGCRARPTTSPACTPSVASMTRSRCAPSSPRPAG
jgi:NADPH-dependent 2,4-dienoyl-CoA reductase/sulfur reductase-like enzyme